jgi:ElaB/YqjD/DUF883 family membrane-anchored ribosome-binding protein
MDNMEKMKVMDKLVRELEDLTNSQTSLLKKIGQVEADNINLGNSLLEKKLPDIYAKIEETLSDVNALQSDFTSMRDKFVKDNRLDEVLPGTN